MAKALIKLPAVPASLSAGRPGRSRPGQTDDPTPMFAETRIVACRPVQYQYRCRVTGAVKAYKKMTPREAAITNLILEACGAHGHWVAKSELIKAYRQGGYRPLDGFVEEGSAAAERP